MRQTQNVEHFGLVRQPAGRWRSLPVQRAGIGLGVARVLAQAGANVTINGLGKQEEIQFVCQQLENGCPFSRVVYSGANLMDGGEATRLIEERIATLPANWRQ